jgi:hypothetical protein
MSTFCEVLVELNLGNRSRIRGRGKSYRVRNRAAEILETLYGTASEPHAFLYTAGHVLLALVYLWLLCDSQ